MTGDAHRHTEDAPGGPPQISKFVLLLALFVVCNSLLVNLALPRLPWHAQQASTLDYTTYFFAEPPHADSWKPMRTALFYLDEPRKKPMYTAIYFDNNVRFQYPPSSLLVLRGLRRLLGEGSISDASLNGISWACVWLLCGVIARIFQLARRRYRKRPSSSPFDETGFARDETGFALLAFVVTLTFYPIVRGYYLGQIQIWIDLLIACVIWSWLEERRSLAGVLVSLVCVIKPTLALVIVWGVVRRHWDFIAGFAIPMACFAVISLASFGWENHVDYLRVLSYISRQGEVFHPNQSMNGLLHRMFGNGDSINWARDVLVTYNPWVHAGTVISSLVLLFLGLWRGRGAGAANDPLDLAIIILCSTLAAPTVWTHHYGVTLPLFALALPAWLARPAAVRVKTGLLLVFSFVLISNNFRALNRLADHPLNFLQSYVYIGGLALLFVLYRLRGEGEAEEEPSSLIAAP